jgi:translocation and assembly module TamB
MEKETVKRIGKWIGVILGGVVLLLLLAVGSVLLLLQTQFGRDRVSALVVDLTRDTPYQVSLEGLGGALPWRLEVDQVSLSDAQGIWLVLEGVRVRWAVMDALRQVYHFPSLRAERVHLQRLPEGDDHPDEARKRDVEEPFSIPELPAVRVGELLVHRLIIAEEVFGRGQVLTVEGMLDTEGDVSRALLTIEEPNGVGDGIMIDVRHDPGIDRLSVQLRVSEEPGGIVAGLLGLDDSGPVLATVSGEGPLQNWQGEYSASIGGYGRAEGQIGLSLQRELTVSLSGSAVVEEGLVPAEAVALLGNEAEFSVRLIRTDETLRFEEAVIRAGTVGLGAEGFLAVPAQTLDVQINITFDEIPGAVTRFLEESGVRLINPGPVQGAIRGSLRQPEIEADLTAERLAIESVDLAGPRIALQGQLLRDPDLETTGFAGRVAVSAQSLLIPELPALSPVDGVLNFSTPDFETFNVPQLTLNSPGLDITGSGTLHREGWRTEGTIDVRVTDPDTLFGIGSDILPGRLRVRSAIKGSLAPPDVILTVEATASGLEGLPEVVRTLTGERISLKTDVSFRESVIRATDFVLTGAAVELRGSGQADLEQERFSLVSQGVLRNLALLPGEFEGALTIDAEAAGRFDAFNVSGTARGTDVRVSGEPFTEPVSDFSLTGLPSAIEGQLGLTAGYLGQPVEASGGFTLDDGERLSISGFEARAPGLSLVGDLQADLEHKRFSGGLRGEAKDLSFISAVTGLELAGQVSANVELATVQSRQSVAVDLRGANLSFEELSASKLTLSGQIRDAFVKPQGTVQVGLEDGLLQAVQLTRLDASLSGGLDELDFRAQAGGRLEYPFALAVAGSAAFVDARRTLRVDTLSGEYATLPFELEQPTTLTMSEELLRLTELVLRVDQGILGAEGELRQEEVEVRLTLRDLPVEVLSVIHPIPAGGVLEGDLLLVGPLTSPILKADFSSTLSFDVMESGRPALQSMISGSALVEEGSFTAALTATGIGPDPVRAEISFPAVFSLSPFAFDVPSDGELLGSLTGTVEIQTLTRLVLLEGHSLVGRITADLALDGTVSDPLLQGRILLADGRYENYGLAMLVERVNATILARGRELVLDSFRATDGGRGRMTAEGVLEMDPDRSFPFRTAFTFRSFQALRDPELSTQTTGDVQFVGDSRSGKASGKLTLDPLNLTIPDRIAPAIAQLEVKEINVAPRDREARRADGPAYLVDLDLTLDFPARFFIRGRGLDAEFSGNLSVTGTAQDPVIRGTMSVVRGDFTFLERRFELTEASVIFTGATPPVPILDVTAEWTRQEITVLVRLTGSAMEPTIALESDPPLPSDEILSRVIFGRSVTELSPLQALRLANALRVLTTGAGNGFDILGTLRTTFGLDELEIRDEADGTALDVGRYLHENVYLRLTKGLGTGRDKVSVEVELHRYVSVESEVGTDSQGGIGINYRRNY